MIYLNHFIANWIQETAYAGLKLKIVIQFIFLITIIQPKVFAPTKSPNIVSVNQIL